MLRNNDLVAVDSRFSNSVKSTYLFGKMSPRSLPCKNTWHYHRPQRRFLHFGKGCYRTSWSQLKNIQIRYYQRMHRYSWLEPVLTSSHNASLRHANDYSQIILTHVTWISSPAYRTVAYEFFSGRHAGTSIRAGTCVALILSWNVTKRIVITIVTSQYDRRNITGITKTRENEN